MITDRTLSLLQSLSSTRSPSKQLSLIQEYCLYEGDMAQQSQQIEELLTIYRQVVKDTHQQGIKAASQRKKMVKPHQYPKFFPTFNGQGNCDRCGAIIDGAQKPVPAFFHRYGTQSNEVRIYCPLPSCFPLEHKAKMLEDRDYLKKMIKAQ